MKKLICVLLCAVICCLTSSCVVSRKTDVFELLYTYEQSEPNIKRRNDMFVKDGVYYVFYDTEDGKTFMLSVAADKTDTPQRVKMIFSSTTSPDIGIIKELAENCLAVFSGKSYEECSEILKLAGAESESSYFKKHDGEAAADKITVKMTSLPLFTVFDFGTTYIYSVE